MDLFWFILEGRDSQKPACPWLNSPLGSLPICPGYGVPNVPCPSQAISSKSAPIHLENDKGDREAKGESARAEPNLVNKQSQKYKLIGE